MYIQSRMTVQVHNNHEHIKVIDFKDTKLENKDMDVAATLEIKHYHIYPCLESVDANWLVANMHRKAKRNIPCLLYNRMFKKKIYYHAIANKAIL